MNRPFIKLSDVSVHYESTSFQERSLKSWLLNLARKNNFEQPKYKNIRALTNVSVEIKSGERVGLIGHNGAGKSTFLKTVAGLYPLSSGNAVVRGDIRSLFDLSLGFEPDATGRENILYRGLLLGLTPKTIREKESEIVNFADLSEFIDYPIKTYSAGMCVRLAFAISTAISGNILLLDEVIGAGDATFMAKAKTRILNLVSQAEIVLLASHDFNSLSALCSRGILLHKGQLLFDGSIENAILEYKKVNNLQ